MGDIRACWCVDVESKIAGAGERGSRERCPWTGEKLGSGAGCRVAREQGASCPVRAVAVDQRWGS